MKILLILVALCGMTGCDDPVLQPCMVGKQDYSKMVRDHAECQTAQLAYIQGEIDAMEASK